MNAIVSIAEKVCMMIVLSVAYDRMSGSFNIWVIKLIVISSRGSLRFYGSFGSLFDINSGTNLTLEDKRDSSQTHCEH